MTSDAPGLLVDFDQHPRVSRVDDLFPFMSVGWREFYRTSPFYGMSDREPPPAGLPSDNPATFARCFLDDAGVGTGVLVSIQAAAVNGIMDHARAAAFTRSFNDYLVDRWLAADGRFRLAAVVSPLDPASAAREIRRVSRIDGVVAIVLPLLDRLLGSGHYDPIFSAAQKVGLPILIHPTPAEGAISGAPAFAGGIPTSPEMRSVLLPEIALTALTSLVFDGVLQDYPELRFLFSDYGFEWLPTALWRLDGQWAAAGGRLLQARRRPSDVIRERVAFCGPAAVADQDWGQLWSLLASVGMEGSILFGSDAPYRSPGKRRMTPAGAARRFFGNRL
jgi:predicted TIM-barrel fold metal-dependent hydrolase